MKVINAGEMRNKGVEINLGLRPIIKDNFSWDVDFNFSKNETHSFQEWLQLSKQKPCFILVFVTMNSCKISRKSFLWEHFFTN